MAQMTAPTVPAWIGLQVLASAALIDTLSNDEDTVPISRSPG
jgi:hypothetical protein